MTTRILCPDCGQLQPAQLDSREETYTYRGENIATRHEFFVCAVCGAEISTAEQADKSFESVRECYRSTHNLVTANEIRAIRGKYGAGQKPFGLILGLGEGTIAKYERGELPTTAHSTLIRLMANDQDFHALYSERRTLIGRTQQRRIEEHLQARRPSYSVDIDTLITREAPDEYTGFRKPAFLCDYEFFRAGPCAQSPLTENIFDTDELSTIHEVAKRWTNASPTELSEYTHSLLAWQKTGHAQEISYVLALTE